LIHSTDHGNLLLLNAGRILKKQNRNIFHFLCSVTAICLACIYCAFQFEVFDVEYENNNPLPGATPTFNYSSDNWESFDKTNAPAAFVLNVSTHFELQIRHIPSPGETSTAFIPFKTARDKSRLLSDN